MKRSSILLSSIVIIVTAGVPSSTITKNQSITTSLVVGAMRLVVQRVKSASVTTTTENNNNQIVAQIGPGILALVGIHIDDTVDDVSYCCQHLINCKLWDHPTTHKPWKQSLKQRQYECLLVSQFTLYGTVNKKSSYTPDYKYAMKSTNAQLLYQTFVEQMQSQYSSFSHPEKVQSGIFGAMMDVALINDGPVTIIIDSRTNSSTGGGSCAVSPSPSSTLNIDTSTNIEKINSGSRNNNPEKLP